MTVPKVYLGDAVYASYDGYHIVLELSDGLRTYNPIALEPAVMQALIRYNDDIKRWNES